MAEPSLSYIKKLATLFCKKYNTISNKHFQFKGIEKNSSDVDFYIVDNLERIGIQHSIVERSKNFYKTSAQTYKVTQRIEKMGKRHGLKCTLYLFFDKIPLNDNDIERFASTLILFLNEHLKTSQFKPRFEKNSDLPKFKIIFEYLEKFEILSTNDKDFVLKFIGNTAWVINDTVDNYTDYLLAFIIKKDSKYTPASKDVILLIESESMPISERNLNILREKCKNKSFNFGEIWTISLGNNGFCARIFP